MLFVQNWQHKNDLTKEENIDLTNTWYPLVYYECLQSDLRICVFACSVISLGILFRFSFFLSLYLSICLFQLVFLSFTRCLLFFFCPYRYFSFSHSYPRAQHLFAALTKPDLHVSQFSCARLQESMADINFLVHRLHFNLPGFAKVVTSATISYFNMRINV